MILYYFLVMHTLYSIALIGTRPIVSLFADYHGASPVIIGLLVSAYAFFPMLMAITVGKWLDHYGARKITLLGGGGMALALLIPAWFPRIEALFLSQALFGFTQLCVLLALQKTVGNLPGNRDKLMAAFSLTGSTGELLGPLLSGFVYEHYGFQMTYGTAFLLVLVGVGMGLLLKQDHWKSASPVTAYKKQDLGSTVRLLTHVNLRKALIISGLVLLSKDLFIAYFPVYATSRGLGPSQIGMILSIMAAMAMMIRISQFYLVEKFGRGKVMTTTLLISSFSFIFIPFSSQMLILGVVAALLGAGLGLGQPLSLVYALNHSPQERQGEVLGLRLTFNRTSQFAAPFLFGAIGGMAGVSPIFWVSGVILMMGAFFTRLTPASTKEKITIRKEA